MWTSVRYILICALRDKLFSGLILGVLLVAGISAGLGGAALMEEKEMALAFASASSRLLLMVGLSVFVCFHIRSAFDTREIDVMLSRPISRAQLAVAFWLGFALIATLLCIPVGLALAAIAPVSWQGYGLWMASLMLEAWVLVALALFAALTLKSAVASVLASLGFYTLARMMAFFAMTAHNMGIEHSWMALLKYALTGISLIVPRMDFFAKSAWLIYGPFSAQEALLPLIQALIFIPLLVAACAIDFRNKQF